jgi:hypothetical protein
MLSDRLFYPYLAGKCCAKGPVPDSAVYQAAVVNFVPACFSYACSGVTGPPWITQKDQGFRTCNRILCNINTNFRFDNWHCCCLFTVRPPNCGWKLSPCSKSDNTLRKTSTYSRAGRVMLIFNSQVSRFFRLHWSVPSRCSTGWAC